MFKTSNACRRATACFLGSRGEIISGHEFHCSAILAEEGEVTKGAWSRRGAGARGELRRGNVTGTFPHMMDKRGPASSSGHVPVLPV